MTNSKDKVLFICSFSNQTIREKLQLKKWRIRNAIMKLFKHPVFVHTDKGVWVSDFIQEFEKHSEFEYHILSPHQGMTHRHQAFNIKEINYHFIKIDYSLLGDVLNAKFKIDEKSDYRRNRRIIHRIIDKINPDIVVICGAENPEYSSIALDIDNHPVYVVLQTVLNNPRLAQFTSEAKGYRADMERKIFQKVNYYGTSSTNYSSLYKNINPKALCLSVKFPSHKPPLFDGIEKKYDFVYFGRMTKNKGVEDAIKAMGKLIRHFPKASLCMIGSASADYEKELHHLVEEFGVKDNVVFMPRFELLEDLYAEVQKSRVVLLPGITAFNSTGRESMLMGLPIITYDKPVVRKINAEKPCLLSAKMEDVDDLAGMMIYAMEHPEQLAVISANGKDYAELNYNNSTTGDKIAANFRAIIDHYCQGAPIQDDLLLL